MRGICMPPMLKNGMELYYEYFGWKFAGTSVREFHIHDTIEVWFLYKAPLFKKRRSRTMAAFHKIFGREFEERHGVVVSVSWHDQSCTSIRVSFILPLGDMVPCRGTPRTADG